MVGFGFSPADYQQGDTVRIMYVHVPSAWMALFCYAAMAVCAAAGLIWRHPLAHVIAHGAAPIGACFTIVCLATGMLWGKPMWGRWWAWDARLTSVLILLFLYLGYIALANAFDNTTRGDRSSAILALVGAVNLPVIKFSVDLVEHAAPAGERDPDRRAGDPCVDADAAAADGRGVHVPVRDAAVHPRPGGAPGAAAACPAACPRPRHARRRNGHRNHLVLEAWANLPVADADIAEHG